MVLSMARWVGRTAIVTGASSGIGYAVTERLVNEGMHVVALARRKSLLDELASKLSGKKGKIYPIAADLSKEYDILSVFVYIKDNLGPVHVVVNNAGTNNPGTLTEGETEEWRRILDVNVLGLSIVTREAVKNMKENNVDGHIIHMNSVLGHYVKTFPGTFYTPSKHAVTVLAEMLRLELANLKLKIKVTSISPGLVDTEIIDPYRKSEMMMKIIEDKVILDREDIVDGIIYVLSTPPHVQVHELMIRPVGEYLGNS